LYFVANLGNTFEEGWVKIGKGTMVSKNHPIHGESLMHGRIPRMALKCFYVTSWRILFFTGGADGSELLYRGSNEKRYPIVPVNGDSFLNEESHPFLLLPKLMELKSWTTLPDSAEYFSGTADLSNQI
jgi:hypothetical protein